MRQLILVLLFASLSPIAYNEEIEPTEQSEEQKPPTIELPGDTVRCVNIRRIGQTRVLDGHTILFKMGRRETLVNRLARDCPGLRFEKRIGYVNRTGRLCRGDTIFVLTSHGRGASCALGGFEPYIEGDVLQPGIDNEHIEVGAEPT